MPAEAGNLPKVREFLEGGANSRQLCPCSCRRKGKQWRTAFRCSSTMLGTRLHRAVPLTWGQAHTWLALSAASFVTWPTLRPQPAQFGEPKPWDLGAPFCVIFVASEGLQVLFCFLVNGLRLVYLHSLLASTPGKQGPSRCRCIPSGLRDRHFAG